MSRNGAITLQDIARGGPQQQSVVYTIGQQQTQQQEDYIGPQMETPGMDLPYPFTRISWATIALFLFLIAILVISILAFVFAFKAFHKKTECNVCELIESESTSGGNNTVDSTGTTADATSTTTDVVGSSSSTGSTTDTSQTSFDISDTTTTTTAGPQRRRSLRRKTAMKAAEAA